LKKNKLKKNIKGAFCPNCKKKLFRRKVKRNKPTKCNYCNFVIQNPYDIFFSKKQYLELKNKKNNLKTPNSY